MSENTRKGWGIDLTTGTPILVYDGCSVIQDEQAWFVFGLIEWTRAFNNAPTTERGAREAVLASLNTDLSWCRNQASVDFARLQKIVLGMPLPEPPKED